MSHRTTLVLCLSLWTAPASAQQLTISSDLLFYGDNTEFANPFRAGETLLGVAGRVLLDVAISDAVTVRGGFFGRGRFGARNAFEDAEPAIALEVSRGPSRFIFGSLQTGAWAGEIGGPDADTPHGLLPPLQAETLVFTRGQEMGLQWLVDGPRLEQDAWIDWQRLNSADARERFDAGYRAKVTLARGLRVHGQWHTVHEGGQQFSVGAVSDSQAAALGLEWSSGREDAKARRRTILILDAHVVGTQAVPDREQPGLREGGVGVFSRAAVQHGRWRAHLLAWRGWDSLKVEGDANYLALRRDGSFFSKVRDYAELGLTRHFRPAPGVRMFAAFRLHRVERHLEYSYRIAARVRLRGAL